MQRRRRGHPPALAPPPRELRLLLTTSPHFWLMPINAEGWAAFPSLSLDSLTLFVRSQADDSNPLVGLARSVVGPTVLGGDLCLGRLRPFAQGQPGRIDRDPVGQIAGGRSGPA